MKVMKFGGTSVGKPERMHQVSQLITKDKEAKIVVLSALSGTTNSLVEIGNSIAAGERDQAKQQIDKLETHYLSFIKDLVKKENVYKKAKDIITEHFEFLNIILKISYSEALNKDILAQGELLSTKLFSVYLEEQGIDYILLPALEFMSIDIHDEPQVIVIRTKLNQLLQKYKDKSLFITQGYICRNAKGEVDNLKRGGSDYTASLVAAAINASVCEIWTDIDGMHNNDPRIVKKTIPVEQLSFDEAAELAYFGAKILHPTCIWPAQQQNVPVKLLNTMQPDAPGTVIRQEAIASGVKAVAAKDGIIAINIENGRLYEQTDEQLRRKVHELATIHRVSSIIASTLMKRSGQSAACAGACGGNPKDFQLLSVGAKKSRWTCRFSPVSLVVHTHTTSLPI